MNEPPQSARLKKFKLALFLFPMTKHSALLTAVLTTPWAILPVKLQAILGVVHRHLSGEKLPPEEVAAIVGEAQAARSAAAPAQNNIAILPLFGTIFPRANLMTEMSGATSAERWGKLFAQAVADSNVSAIVIDVDSPGGAVSGVDELSSQIFKARGSKPIVAVANHLAASAAYWLATAADELVVTPSGEVGSIGVFAAHENYAEALKAEGIEVTLISAGKFKTEGNPYGPLTDEARAMIQDRVNDYYDAFTKAVARNRGVSVEGVRDGFGEGRVVGAKEAVRLGMADRIETINDTVARLGRSVGTRPLRPMNSGDDTDFRRRRARALNLETIGSVEP